MIYNLAMYILELGVKLAALFSDKPAKMVKGYREVFDLLQRKIDRNAQSGSYAEKEINRNHKH